MPLNPELLRDQTERTGLADYAFSVIQDSIISGRMPPGSRLYQLKLAEELKVDQRTVREALARLIAHGLAVHAPNRGTRVVDFRLQDIEDIYRIRGFLEPWAMEEAAKQITSEDLTQMGELLPLSIGGTGDADVPETRDANREFHWVAIRASGRNQLIRILDQVWDLSITYAIRAAIGPGERTQASSLDSEHHLALLEALTAGDGPSAAHIAKTHIDKSLQNLLRRWEMFQC